MYMTGFVFNKIRCLRLFLQVLRSLIEEKKDWYLDELTAAMKERTRKSVSVPTLWHLLHYCGITRQKVFVVYTNSFIFLSLLIRHFISSQKQPRNAMKCDVLPSLQT